ncbi:MAG TPA: hypothetical protein VHM30_09685, partial [Gemmatimonadaceae bacterium]|nr:hypothetical protein [Gemmatimonadaceae bacterium]
GASSRVGELLDDAVSSLVTGVHGAFQGRLEGWVNELKEAIGAPQNANRSRGDGTGASSGAGSWQSQGAGASGFSAASAGTLGAGDSAQLGRAD